MTRLRSGCDLFPCAGGLDNGQFVTSGNPCLFAVGFHGCRAIPDAKNQKGHLVSQSGLFGSILWRIPCVGTLTPVLVPSWGFLSLRNATNPFVGRSLPTVPIAALGEFWFRVVWFAIRKITYRVKALRIALFQIGLLAKPGRPAYPKFSPFQ